MAGDLKVRFLLRNSGKICQKVIGQIGSMSSEMSYFALYKTCTSRVQVSLTVMLNYILEKNNSVRNGEDSVRQQIKKYTFYQYSQKYILSFVDFIPDPIIPSLESYI